MPRQSFQPIGRDRLELSPVWIPAGEGSEADRAATSSEALRSFGPGGMAFRAMFLSDGYDGLRPGHPWVEIGRMVLAEEGADEMPLPHGDVSSRWPTIRAATEADQSSATPHAAERSGTSAQAAAGEVGAEATAPHSATNSCLDVDATIRNWNLLADPHATSAVVNSVSDQVAAVLTLAQYSPASPIVLPLPPVFMSDDD